METDSLVLNKMLSMEWKIPWEIVHLMEEIQQKSRFVKLQIHHTYREANTLADFLANLAITIGAQ